ncbi:MAG: C45 family autoproteolytic acyltransferase/hydolase [Solirubrobacteraceae bacterium]
MDAAAIDDDWKPVWAALHGELELLPAQPGRDGPTRTTQHIEFAAFRELEPGPRWQAHFNAMWPTYRAWYLHDGEAARPDVGTCRRMLAQHMPELMATYDKLVELAGGGELPARMLSLYRPPGFVVGCSQGAWTRDAPVLVRNYDYPVSRLEGIVYLTQWSGARVIGMSDCLWGLLDGINEAGLAVSLTFGGRHEVGDGFAIPLVVRYLLETCDTVAHGRAALARIPVHASQNITMLDRHGEVLTAYVGPGRAPEFRALAVATNHQGKLEWPEYDRATQTVERERFVRALLEDPSVTRERFVAAFLAPPLRNTEYAKGFGTIYTAAYHPAEGGVDYLWPDAAWRQSFDRFHEDRHAQTFVHQPHGA